MRITLKLLSIFATFNLLFFFSLSLYGQTIYQIIEFDDPNNPRSGPAPSGRVVLENLADHIDSRGEPDFADEVRNSSRMIAGKQALEYKKAIKAASISAERKGVNLNQVKTVGLIMSRDASPTDPDLAREVASGSYPGDNFFGKPKGFVTVVIHGYGEDATRSDARVFYDLDSAGGQQSYTAGQIAQAIRNSGVWVDGQPIMLKSCMGGTCVAPDGATSAAAALSKALDTDIVSTTGNVKMLNHLVTSPDTNKIGGRYTHHSGGSDSVIDDVKRTESLVGRDTGMSAHSDAQNDLDLARASTDVGGGKGVIGSLLGVVALAIATDTHATINNRSYVMSAKDVMTAMIDDTAQQINEDPGQFFRDMAAETLIEVATGGLSAVYDLVEMAADARGRVTFFEKNEALAAKAQELLDSDLTADQAGKAFYRYYYSMINNMQPAEMVGLGAAYKDASAELYQYFKTRRDEMVLTLSHQELADILDRKAAGQASTNDLAQLEFLKERIATSRAVYANPPIITAGHGSGGAGGGSSGGGSGGGGFVPYDPYDPCDDPTNLFGEPHYDITLCYWFP